MKKFFYKHALILAATGLILQNSYAAEGTLSCNLDYQSFRYSDFSQHVFNTPFSLTLNTDQNLGPIPVKILDSVSDSSLREEFLVSIRVAASKVSVTLNIHDLSEKVLWEETKEIQPTGEPAVFTPYDGAASKNLNRIKITSAVCTFKSLKKTIVTDSNTKVMPTQIDSTTSPISRTSESQAKPVR